MYILGDLFEAWIGDDAVGPFERGVAEALRGVHEGGTRIFFLHGNRDFLLGPAYCQAAGMQLLEQPVTVDLYGTPTLLLHGDVLCTRDIAYQRYRRRSSDPAWQARILARPVWFRRGLATALRMTSRLLNRNRDRDVLDVTDSAVDQLFERTRVRRMIHGHTHRPFRHIHEVAGRQCERIVLGDWYDQGSVMVATSAGIELESLASG